MHATGGGESPENPALRVWVGAGWFDVSVGLLGDKLFFFAYH